MKQPIFFVLLASVQLAAAQQIPPAVRDSAVGQVASLTPLPMPTFGTTEHPPIEKPWFPRWFICGGHLASESVLIWGIPAQYGEAYHPSLLRPQPQNGLIKGYFTQLKPSNNENMLLEPFTF